ncbi:hypothetical protein CMQ_8135 [Grosmannia clavigera kw1407]|uniref:Methyltransferase domain-containing protein n=1 Tax=Grosmannia clavigera (strain kw1407 / UAMH 11150) TaxID=655863 RepID=F0XKG1_GROCL|nr:uncharacterized protein CMQ_8135 [Grosmannia clavigera kw1407]EFX01669.1 hypothetical protein CMQ_8135 [Grosmannia clavigera kw1407]
MASTDNRIDPQAAWRYAKELPADAKGLEKAWKLLETYSDIPSDQVAAHITAVAYAVFPYPCLSRWRFLDLYLAVRPEYPDILKRLLSGDRLLDAGCCFGQVLRQLIYDGAPPESVAGTDLRPEFIELGYELFQDRSALPASTFVTGDIFAASSPDGNDSLARLDGRFGILHTASFFHLFDWDDQVRIGERIVRFFRPDVREPLVLGRQVGNRHAQAIENMSRTGEIYRYNPASMQRLWDEIGARTGTRWSVAATMVDPNDDSEEEFKRILIQFAVTKAA